LHQVPDRPVIAVNRPMKDAQLHHDPPKR
jgi:hypothetical protein